MRARAVARRLPPEVKVVAAFAFVLAVVVTPREAFVAFAAYAVLVGVAAAVAGVTLRRLGSRLAFEVPFVLFAVLLPFIGGGSRTDWGRFAVSVEGTWAAWNILAKATLGVLVATVLSATTAPAELLAGLRRLRCPAPLLAIAGFMIRYLDVLTGQSRRLQIARVSRGDDPHWIWQGRALTHHAGTLFVRSYERGERVALAMAARGYTGVMPDVFGGRHATTAEWLSGLALPAMAVAVATTAVLR